METPMTRASRRGRAVRAPRAQGKVVTFLLLAIFLPLIGFALFWGVPRLVRFVGAVSSAGAIWTTPVPMTTPGTTPQPTPDPINKPFTVLLLGVDRRGEGEGGTRSDVNIVVYVDPVKHFASMLSIPRDTRVYIPDCECYRKINAAYSIGETYYADAGGGPGLAMRTVQFLIDVPVDYYAEIDFQGFERIVDLVGGIIIDVPTPLEDNEYPTPDYGYTRIYIPAGLQHMDGRTALQYARSRHADSDIGRNRRQQQVLMAIRDRVLRLDTLTDIDKMTDLLNQLSGSLRTDIQPGILFSMLRLSSQIPAESISSYGLDYRHLTEISGTSDLEPCIPCVREIVRQMRLDPTLRKLAEEGARVEVQNGTETPGLARRTAEYLYQSGFASDHVAITDADRSTYTQTLLFDSGPHTFTQGLLVQLLHISPGNVHQVEPGEIPTVSYPDIVIILGSDFVEPRQ